MSPGRYIILFYTLQSGDSNTSKSKQHSYPRHDLMIFRVLRAFLG